MVKKIITPHSIGWSKAAADAAKKRRKESRAKIRKIPWAVAKDALKELWREHAWVHWIKGLGIIISVPIAIKKKIAAERRITKRTANIVAYALLEEMQRDEKFKNEMAKIIKSEEKGGLGMKWLYIDRNGRIILSDNPKMGKMDLGDTVRKFRAPRADMEVILGMANAKYINTTAPIPTMIALRGNTVLVSEMNPDVNLRKAEVISSENMRKVTIRKAAVPGKLALRFFMKDGTVKKYEVDKEEAKAIYKRMK